MPDTRLTTAVKGLDPASRALLDLSLRRRIPDDEIAQLLRTTPREIAVRRAAAIRRLGTDLDVERPEQLTAMLAAIAELPPEAWGVPSAALVAPDSPPPREVAVASRGGGRGGWRVALAGIPLTALGATVAMLLVAGGDETAREQGQLVPGTSQALRPPSPGPQGRALADGDDRRDGRPDAGGGADGQLVATLTLAEPGGGAAPRREAGEREEPRRKRSRRPRKKRTVRTAPVEQQLAAAPLAVASSDLDTGAGRRQQGEGRRSRGADGGGTGGGPQGSGGGGDGGDGGRRKGSKLFGDDKPGKGPLPLGDAPAGDPHGQGPSLPQGPPPAPAVLPPGQERKRRRAGS